MRQRERETMVKKKKRIENPKPKKKKHIKRVGGTDKKKLEGLLSFLS